MAQLKDLTIDVAERVGSVADAAEALGRAGINIEGVCGFVVNGKGILHVLVENAATARAVLLSAGARVTAEDNAALFEIEDRPGTLGQLTRKIAVAGVSLSAVYLATRTRVVIVARQLEEARAAVGESAAAAPWRAGAIMAPSGASNGSGCLHKEVHRWRIILLT